MNLTHPVIHIGMGTCGKAAGADGVYAAAKGALNRMNLLARVLQVGCIGMCYLEPIMAVKKPGGPFIYYGNLTAEKTEKILSAGIMEGDPKPEWAFCTMGEKSVDGIGLLRGFAHDQTPGTDRIAQLRHNKSREYRTLYGQRRVRRTSEGSQDEPGRRGRGNQNLRTTRTGRGGLSHGNKVGVRGPKAPGKTKYLVCNADEGDPGAFMDRSLLEGDPHAVLEGMLIAAYAIGCAEGYVYIRAEYPLAIERLEKALAQISRMRSPGPEYSRKQMGVSDPYQGRGRGLRVRGGDGPHGLYCRRQGHAAARAHPIRQMRGSGETLPISITWRHLPMSRQSLSTMQPGLRASGPRRAGEPKRSPWPGRCGERGS